MTELARSPEELREVADLFMQLSPETQNAIIDLMNDLIEENRNGNKNRLQCRRSH